MKTPNTIKKIAYLFTVGSVALSSAKIEAQQQTRANQRIAPAIAQAPAAGRERISDATYLRKLSLHIRGRQPTTDEYKALQEIASPVAREAFLRRKINEYFATTQHENRMVFRLAELFQIKTPAAFANDASGVSPDLFQYGGVEVKKDSMTDLFARMAKDNLSWDQLLVAKNYTAYPKTELRSSGISDIGFFKAAHGGLPNVHEGANSTPFTTPGAIVTEPIPVVFRHDDTRVAGALTTRRFISRYQTTALNKNRRRAAAVFRIFLCDAMVPAIETGTDRKHEFLDTAFAERFEVTEAMIQENITLTGNARHGTDPQCMSCHSKLDPLGRTFQPSGVVLGIESSPGALFFRRSSTENVFVKTKGIGDLAQAITEQPEYSECQVRWFWKEFIGVDVPLSGTRLQQLIHDFNRVGRRTNDFIKILVQSEEFRTKPLETQFVSFGQVKNLLKRCDSCHAQEGVIPVFARIPIGYSGSEAEQLKWLNSINERMHLPDDNKKKMPRDWATNWSQADLDLIKQWSRNGARDENGNALLRTGAGQ